MQRRFIPCVLLVIGVSSACDGNVRLFPEDRTYRHELFTTPEECEAFQNAGGINCAQYASYCRNGNADVVVTDIVNPATYRIDRDIITVSFGTPSELSGRMQYRLSAKEDTLFLLPVLTAWERLPEVLPYDCT